MFARFEKASRLILAGAVAVLSLGFGEMEAQAQWFQVQAGKTYVCQTPAFWCSFQHPNPSVPNRTMCHCLMPYGGVMNGYSIDPGRQSQPAPQTPPPADDEGESDSSPAPTTSDCYNGLGNCEGRYRGGR